MIVDISSFLTTKMNIDKRVIKYCTTAENALIDKFKEADSVCEYNQAKVLHAMQKNRLSDNHFAATTGYGYNDLGRDVLENIYADVFNASSALVRPQIISGTHALTVALFGNLRYGDELLSPVGKPYDTLEGVIGIRKTKGSLMEHGIKYRQVDLKEDGEIDFEGVKAAINSKTKLATIQRSKGYDWRRSLTIEDIKALIYAIKSVREDVICMVDNCYGEFVDILEPSDVGADLVVGSLIKNPGGGLAPVGGYILGKEEYVENSAFRLTSPGLGREVGPTLGITPALIQGLFMAPSVVCASLKGAILSATCFEGLGFKVNPGTTEKRSDIVQAINMKTKENMITFCKGIQMAAPVDSFVTPEPWAMPGYDCPVIMAAGAFNQGSSIELSADGPVKEPFNVFLQGGLTWQHAKIGVIIGINNMYINGLIEL